MVKQKFEPGALVFGKVKGYPPWPARVTAIASKDRYKVYFYGTYETGSLKAEDMWPYNQETKAKFAQKNMKKKGYTEGIDQIENTPEIAAVEEDVSLPVTPQVAKKVVEKAVVEKVETPMVKAEETPMVKVETPIMEKVENKFEVETPVKVIENELDNKAPVEKVITTTTTKTRATPTIAPLGVTIRTAVTQRRTARPTTRRTTTQAPVTQAATEGTTQSPGIFGRLGNIINNGVGNVFNAGLGSNIISTGSLLAAAASPLWAPLLVGKKRRKRSEDVSLNEIQQANMQYYTKLIMSEIEKAKNNYY